MGMSVSLRNASGSIVGFVMLLCDRLVYRIAGNKESVELLVLSCGKVQAFAACADGCEHEVLFDASDLDDACVRNAGGVYAASSENAKRFALADDRRNLQLKKDAADEKLLPDKIVLQKREDPEEASTNAGERRWPPPPCIMKPRYQTGKWFDAE